MFFRECYDYLCAVIALVCFTLIWGSNCLMSVCLSGRRVCAGKALLTASVHYSCGAVAGLHDDVGVCVGSRRPVRQRPVEMR